MKYVALLRGINVGGNNIIKMAVLKQIFEESGFEKVRTYINSGNVIFESKEKSIEKITTHIEAELTKAFNYNAIVVVRTHEQMKEITENMPREWKSRDDIRCYVAFTKEPLTPQETLKDIDLKEGIDSIKLGPHAVYMTTLLSGLTKSSLNKLPSKKIYQYLTIRNLNTTKKILELMEEL